MIKKFDEFINEARLEYRRDHDFEDMSDYIHDPEVFVYADKKLLNFSEMLCSQINKYAKLNLYVYGEFGKIDGVKVVMLMDRDSDKCVCIMPSHGRTIYASLYYFEKLEQNTDVADFYMSSETIGIVNLIKTFCDIIKSTDNIKAIAMTNEAYDYLNNRKLKVDPDSIDYVEQILKIKPGQKGGGRNKVWEGEWTQELIDEINKLSAEGKSIWDIAYDVETNKENSKYWKYFGAEAKMNPKKRDTLLIYLLNRSGVQLDTDKSVAVSDCVYTDEDEWYMRVAHTKNTEEAQNLIKEFDVNVKSIEEIINDYVEFYKAKGNDKLEILSYTPQLLIVPGKGGIGKTTMVKKMLESRGLRKNIDYICTGSMSSDAESIYNTCYDYNGKIIILDDIPELFAGSQRQSLWKNLISGNMGEYGEPSVAARSTTTRYYDIRKFGKNMRARYYAEAGDGATLGAAKSRELNAALKSSNPVERKKAEREQEELEMVSKNVNKPMTFTFTGVIIALSNVSPAEMKKEIGSAQSWQAISTRGRIIELNPPGWVLWLKDKNTILAQTSDTSIPDDCTIIPRDMVDEYVKYVESVISDGSHENFNYRISSYVGKMMRKHREWKQIVEQRSRSNETEF